MKYLIALSISLLILGFTYLLKDKVCKHFKLIDHATNNTVHKKDALLYGGIFLLVGFLLNYFFVLFISNQIIFFYNFNLVIFFFFLHLLMILKIYQLIQNFLFLLLSLVLVFIMIPQ